MLYKFNNYLILTSLGLSSFGCSMYGTSSNFISCLQVI